MTISAAIEERIADAPLSAHLATSVDDRPHVVPGIYTRRRHPVEGTNGSIPARNRTIP